MKRVGWMALWTLSIGACTLAPAGQPPTIAVAESYAEVGQWVQAEPADAAPKGRWWLRFSDPTLDQLQSELTAGNPTIKIALARLEQARATAQSASASLWPRLSGSVASSRTKNSTVGPNYSPSRANPYTDFVAAGTVTYELDIFGRVRAAADSAHALADAAAGDAAAVELAIRAELTTTYFQLRAIDAQLETLRHTVADDEKALSITERLYAAGAVAISDVSQSRSQLENARTALEDSQLRRAQTEHAVATLLGQAPSQWHLRPSPLPGTVPLPSISTGLPSSLLQRRPDIAAAQRRVQSAGDAVGIARSTYFPSFTLGASLGRESLRSSQWFEAPARFWSVAPSAVVTLLDAGQRRAQVRLASATLDEATQNYRRVVLTAYQEVEDGLAARRALDAEQLSADANVSAAQVSLSQALNRYQAGASSYLEVASAQNNFLVLRLSAITIEQRRIAATTQLIRALGGDWQ